MTTHAFFLNLTLLEIFEMQKKWVALAAIAASGVASAQSSATLFGVVDLGYESVKTNAGRVSGLAPSMNASSRIGVRGVEDLGGGLSASFWLEAALAPMNGSGSSGTTQNNQSTTVAPGGITFNRRSTVSLAGSFGEIRLGRDYTPSYHNYWMFEPFGNNSVGASLTGWTGAYEAATFVRASNSIGYLTPANLGGFYGQAMYAFGNRASTETFSGTTPTYAIGQNTKNNGRYIGLRAGYEQGPISTAIGYGRTTYAPGTNIAAPLGLDIIPYGNFTDLNFGASYQFGAIKVMGLIVRQTMSDAGALGNNATTKGWNIGADWGVGAGDVLLSYGRVAVSSGVLGTEPKSSKWAVGYVHNLSKRTAVYAFYAHVGNSGGAAQTGGSFSSGSLNTPSGAANVNGSSSGIDIGLRHAF